MVTAPDRPRGHPNTWIMAYWSFSAARKPANRYDLSRPRPFHTRAEARTAAETAKQDHEKGKIRVLFAIAYPPVGVNEEPYVVNFQERPAPSA